MDKSGDDPTDKEFKVEEEKFKGMYLLNSSEMLYHGSLLEDLQNASYVSRDGYPTPQEGTFDLLICRYVQIKGISGQGGQGCGGRGGRGGRGM